MILSKDTKPDRQIYRLGALLLEVLQETPSKTPELLDVYARVNKRESVSLSVFMLTLDWLFLLGAIVDDKGRIQKCF